MRHDQQQRNNAAEAFDPVCGMLVDLRAAVRARNALTGPGISAVLAAGIVSSPIQTAMLATGTVPVTTQARAISLARQPPANGPDVGGR